MDGEHDTGGAQPPSAAAGAMPWAAAAAMPVVTPPNRTPRSQKTPIQKEALEAAFQSESLHYDTTGGWLR